MPPVNQPAVAACSTASPLEAEGAAGGTVSQNGATAPHNDGFRQIPLRRHQPRPVVDPQGRVWPSISAAALAHDMLPSSLWPIVHLQRHGWRLARPDEIGA